MALGVASAVHVTSPPHLLQLALSELFRGESPWVRSGRVSCCFMLFASVPMSDVARGP